MRVLLEGRIDNRDRRECSARRVHRHDPADSARQENGVSCTPRGTAEVVDGLVDDFHGSAGGGNLLQRPVGEEANPAAVRRPERILGVLGSGQLRARPRDPEIAARAWVWTPGIAALNTRAWPSGESANEGTLNVVLRRAENSAFSGGKTGKLIESRDDEVVEGRVAKNSVVPRNSAAAIHAAHSR